MRQVRERPVLGRAARLELLGGNEHGCNEAGREQKEAHDESGRREQLARIADTARRALLRVLLVATYDRHYGHPGLEAREPQGELREHDYRQTDHRERATVAGEQRIRPADQVLGIRHALVDPHGHHDEVQQQEGPDHDHGDADGLPEALEENCAQYCHQNEGDEDLVASEVLRHERILCYVRGCVRRREGYGDHKVGRDEAQETQHEDLALPKREQPLEHRDRALPMWTFGGDPPVHRQRSEQRQEHYKQGSQGRESPSGYGGDARLIAKRREIVNPGQARNSPPGLLANLVLFLLLVGPFSTFDLTFEQPTLEASGEVLWRIHQSGHCTPTQIRKTSASLA